MKFYLLLPFLLFSKLVFGEPVDVVVNVSDIEKIKVSQLKEISPGVTENMADGFGAVLFSMDSNLTKMTFTFSYPPSIDGEIFKKIVAGIANILETFKKSIAEGQGPANSAETFKAEMFAINSMEVIGKAFEALAKVEKEGKFRLKNREVLSEYLYGVSVYLVSNQFSDPGPGAARLMAALKMIREQAEFLALLPQNEFNVLATFLAEKTQNPKLDEIVWIEGQEAYLELVEKANVGSYLSANQREVIKSFWQKIADRYCQMAQKAPQMCERLFGASRHPILWNTVSCRLTPDRRI